METKTPLQSLRAILRQRLRRPLYRYLIVGISVYIFELLVIVVSQALGASDLLAVSLSFWFGLVVSFWLQKLVTFGDRRMHHHILLPQIIAVSALVGWNYGFTLLVTALLAPTIPTAVDRTIALLITTIWNFYLYKTRIFKPVQDESAIY